MNSSLLFAILVLVTVNVLGNALPLQSDALIGANANLNGSNFGSKYNSSDSKSYKSENKNYKTPGTTKTTTTTTTEKPKFEEFDYYGDYNGDQPYEEIKAPEPTQRPVSGCPEITIICQQYCENERFYSGYCEDKSCICYGRMYR